MNKKGFFSVYACLFLVVILAAAGIFIDGAKKSRTIGTARACSLLWSQSVLAEYDLNLQQRYHLFGYYGHTAMVRDKLEFYAKESDMGNSNLQITSCSLHRYSLRNIEVFGKQVESCGKVALTDAFNRPAADIKGVTHHEKPENQVLFSDLPSEGCETGLSASKLLENYNLKDVVEEGTAGCFQLAYIFSHFKDQSNERSLGETCLQSEIEYIIGGKTTDSANEKAVRRRVIAVREPVNLAFLERDSAKSSAVYTVASILTPETAAVTAQSIMAAWAYAESVNDYKLLIEGYPVPKVKNTGNWATDLESILAEDEKEGCIYTGETKGDHYEDYLRLFLITMNESTRLLRMMDLIQINMRYSYYEDFSIADYYGGLSYTYQINGETCHAEDTYE